MFNMDVFNNQVPKKKYDFVFKKKNKTLFKFRLFTVGLGVLECTFLDFPRCGEGELPYRFSPSGDYLLNWLQSRFVPKNRAFVDNILSTLPTDDPHLISLLMVTLGLSLNDDYWVLPVGLQELKWEDHNLYANEFSETLSLVAFTGYNAKVKGIVSSPEFTTNGMLAKCWRRIDGKIYLYKSGTEGAANAGLEPYSEFYASQIADVMGLDYVSYELEIWKGRLCSVCELFTSEHRSFVPAYVAYPNAKAIELLRESLNTQDYEKLVDMLIFDAIIANHDRHYGNFGFLRDNHTGKLVGLAPIFDNGLSLLHQAMTSDFSDLRSYLSYREYTFAFIPDSELDGIMQFATNQHKRKIRKLLDFEFDKHPRYNLEDDRLDFLSDFVRFRAKRMLG